MNENWLVYQHISPSGKCYVGITSKGVNERWRNGKRYLIKRKGRYAHPIFAQALLKYGWNNFQHIIVAKDLTHKEACLLEQSLIRKYKDLNISYNVTDGGEGALGLHFHHSKETKENISKHHRHLQTDKTRELISNAQKGKKFSQWRKDILSKAHSKEKIPVVQLSLLGKFIAEYPSIMAASRATGIHNGAIANAIRRKGRAKEFKWLNKKDYIENENKSIS